MPDLALVIPVYNEESAVEGVVLDWLSTLRAAAIDFRIIILNDGSTDKTLSILERLQNENQELEIIDKPNTGHGQSCVVGYRTAVASGYPFILQVDSDGQCDPKYFASFWQAREEGAAVMGVRVNRLDGVSRKFMSRVLSMIVYMTSMVYVKDLNVPYRLMDQGTLKEAIALIPPDFYMANILLSYIYQKKFRIKWIPITFRERSAGKSKFNSSRMASLLFAFLKHLAAIKGDI